MLSSSKGTPLKQSPQSTENPSELRRAVYVFPALAMLILLIGPSPLLSPLWWQMQDVNFPAQLLSPLVAALALGAVVGRDIWNLTVRRNPLWKDLLYGALGLFPFLVAVVLREAGLWLWSFASGDTFVVGLALTITAISAFTERRRSVRVYLSSRHLVVVHEKRDA